MQTGASVHTCHICGQAKPLEQFDKLLAAGPREAWNLGRCKECTHARYMRRRTDPKQLKGLHKSAKNWKRQNRERHAELNREYRLRHPEKIIAQNRLNYAIRKGRIERQPCQVCGSTERVHAHHKSYRPEDWYNVDWLCQVCHVSEHSGG